MKLSNYDSSVLVAKNSLVKLYIVKVSPKNYRFAVTESYNNFSTASTVGEFYDTKAEFLKNAWDYATVIWNFKDSDILSNYPRDSVVTITEDERVAINTAIRLLNFSNSDQADQCLCYLKTLSQKF